MNASKRDVPPAVVEAALRQWSASAETNLIPVRGNSMLPLLNDGDVVCIEHGLRDVRRGDIIVFRQNGGLVVHRLLRQKRRGAQLVFTTKGDNVRHLDAPVAAEDVLGRVLTVKHDAVERALDTRTWRGFGRFVAIFMLVWAVPYSHLRTWKRDRLGARIFRPIQAVSDLFLIVTAAILRMAAWLSGNRELNGAQSAETRLLYLCTRQTLSTEQCAVLDALIADQPIDWAAVFDSARLHGVAPLVGHNLQRNLSTALPPSVAKRFKMMTMQNVTEKRARRSALALALDTFQAHDIAVMPVKGAALDLLVYDQTWYMTSDDIDIVLRVRNEDALPQTVTQMLPQLVQAHVEYDFHSHHDITMNDTLGVDFERIWRDSQAGEWENRPIRLMAWEDMLIAVCINSCRKRFFRLKALCDVAETVERGSDHLDWAVFLNKVEAYGCAAIVYAALTVTQATLGCAVPEDVMAALPVGNARRRIIQRLAGNMTPDAFESIFTGRTLFGRNFDSSLMLQYATLSRRQLSRKARFVWRTRDREPVAGTK